jgi:hypothetical protein
MSQPSRPVARPAPAGPLAQADSYQPSPAQLPAEYINQVDLVRNFRGAPASIVLILLLSGRPHTQQELEEATSYSDKPVRRAIQFLACRGVVGEVGAGGWSLRGEFRKHIVEAFRPPPTGLQEGDPAAADPGIAGRGDTRPEERSTLNDGPAELAKLLGHMGILSPALDTLLARDELLADPALARAWWWYVLTQNWSKNRPGLVIARLNERRDPPPAFLALARIWPTVAASDRLEMRDLLWRAWSPSQMAQYFAENYPQMTAAVFAAFQSLHDAAPDELEI